MFGLLLGECCLLPMLGFSQIILFDIFNVMTKAECQSDDQHDKSCCCCLVDVNLFPLGKWLQSGFIYYVNLIQDER